MDNVSNSRLRERADVNDQRGALVASTPHVDEIETAPRGDAPGDAPSPGDSPSVEENAPAADSTADETAAPREDASYRHIEAPEGTKPPQIYWSYTIALAVLHIGALAAFIPWFFSWTGLIVGILGHFVFGMLGITIGWHRLLTHRGFDCPKWLEYTLATLGVCCLQDSPARWVAIHRMHHQHSDNQPDPHSPLVNFFWGHVGWLLYRNHDHAHLRHYSRYARDLLREPYYLWLERYGIWFFIYIVHAVAFYLVGLAVGWATTGEWLAGVQFGLSLLVWGVFVRTVFVLHGTWAVNSLSHLWGYRNYDTRDHSTNNWLVALFSHGEGWHNNHHADQRSARHGHRWWEFDMSWCVIRTLEAVGLVWNVVRPDPKRPEIEPVPK